MFIAMKYFEMTGNLVTVELIKSVCLLFSENIVRGKKKGKSRANRGESSTEEVCIYMQVSR